MSEAMMGGRAVDAGQGWAWIVDGLGLFKKNPGVWIALIIILLVILFVLASIPFLGTVATFLLMPLFLGGLMRGCRSLQGGGELAVNCLFAGFREHTGNLIVLGALAIGGSIVVMLPVIAIVGAGTLFGLMRGDLAGVAAMGGSFMLAWLVAIALSVPIYMALWFAPALVALRGLAPAAAVKESFQGCLKNVVPFTIYGIVLAVFGIVATIPLGLGWLVLGPVTIGSIYASYRDIYGDA